VGLAEFFDDSFCDSPLRLFFRLVFWPFSPPEDFFRASFKASLTISFFLRLSSFLS
jgi:hypothetical protein